MKHTFGSRYFSLRHTRSVALSAFLCKKSASLSILKEKKKNNNKKNLYCWFLEHPE